MSHVDLSIEVYKHKGIYLIASGDSTAWRNKLIDVVTKDRVNQFQA